MNRISGYNDDDDNATEKIEPTARRRHIGFLVMMMMATNE